MDRFTLPLAGREYLILLLLQKPNVASDDPFMPAVNLSLSSYPNPFTETNKIKYSLPASGKVNLSIYNIKGQKVTTLQAENKKSGYYELEWNGKDSSGNKVSSGLYFCRLETNGKIVTTKLLKLKGM